MIEAGCLLDLEGNSLHWHLPPGRSGGALPDSADLWTVIWENRKRISGFAHSHPGSGLPSPSHTDVTTFAAIEAALGRRLDWWIASSDSWQLFRWVGPGRLEYDGHWLIFSCPEQPGHWLIFSCPEQPYLSGVPSWLERLRDLSGYEPEKVELMKREVVNLSFGILPRPKPDSGEETKKGDT